MAAPRRCPCPCPCLQPPCHQPTCCWLVAVDPQVIVISLITGSLFYNQVMMMAARTVCVSRRSPSLPHACHCRTTSTFRPCVLPPCRGHSGSQGAPMQCGAQLMPNLACEYRAVAGACPPAPLPTLYLAPPPPRGVLLHPAGRVHGRRTHAVQQMRARPFLTLTLNLPPVALPLPLLLVPPPAGRVDGGRAHPVWRLLHVHPLHELWGLPAAAHHHGRKEARRAWLAAPEAEAEAEAAPSQLHAAAAAHVLPATRARSGSGLSAASSPLHCPPPPSPPPTFLHPQELLDRVVITCLLSAVKSAQTTTRAPSRAHLPPPSPPRPRPPPPARVGHHHHPGCFSSTAPRASTRPTPRRWPWWARVWGSGGWVGGWVRQRACVRACVRTLPNLPPHAYTLRHLLCTEPRLQPPPHGRPPRPAVRPSFGAWRVTCALRP